MPIEYTDIIVHEDGTEEHESWLMIRANNISSTPGAVLFDSEIQHQHYIYVSISRCTRKRGLNRDWKHATKLLLEMSMSQAQWGAFVSSFGNGSGVPATLTFLSGQGMVPQAPRESYFDKSHQEVKDAGTKALEEIRRAANDLSGAFVGGATKKVLKEKIFHLNAMIQNGPANMEFAAKSLTEHVENVVTKARADIESMAATAAQAQLDGPVPNPFMIAAGEKETEDETR